MALENRVVLSAEVRSRASDTLTPQQEASRILLTLQANAARNYFRLLTAQQLLASRESGSRAVGSAVLDAMEIERARIARELHSGAGQPLAGIKVNLDLIAEHMPDPPEPVRESLARIGALADQALGEGRPGSQ